MKHHEVLVQVVGLLDGLWVRDGRYVEVHDADCPLRTTHQDDNDFIQPGTLYRQVMSQTDRDHLVDNLVWHLRRGVERSIQERAINEYLLKVDSDLGVRVVRRLGIPAPRLGGER